tara:strand:- start:83 stop:232 length:150 start_codon:yes stop_codon:yes gene_type:complete
MIGFKLSRDEWIACGHPFWGVLKLKTSNAKRVLFLLFISLSSKLDVHEK